MIGYSNCWERANVSDGGHLPKELIFVHNLGVRQVGKGERLAAAAGCLVRYSTPTAPIDTRDERLYDSQQFTAKSAADFAIAIQWKLAKKRWFGKTASHHQDLGGDASRW